MSDAQTRIIDSTSFGKTPDGWDRNLVTTVYYNIGGPNYFSGTMMPRGYYLGVSMDETQDHTRRFSIGKGTALKAFLEPATRFSAKHLAEIAPPADLVQRLRASVLESVLVKDYPVRVAG